MTQSVFNTASPSRPVLSFASSYALMAKQVALSELVAADPDRYESYRELVRIAADVYTHRPEAPIAVGGEHVTYGYLQEIFRSLTGEHIEYVLDRLERYEQEIRYKKAFLRTSLANSVFEMNVGLTNKVRADMVRSATE